MSEKLAIDTIRVGSANVRETGENVVYIQYLSGEEFIFASSFPPATARALAADLIERADYCDAREQQANDVAQQLLAKCQADAQED